MKSALQNVSDGVLVLNQDNCIVWLNKSAVRILGVIEAEVTGKNLVDLFPGFGGGDFITSLAKCYADHTIFQFEDYYSMLDANIEFIAFPGAALRMCLFRDVTQRYRVRDATPDGWRNSSKSEVQADMYRAVVDSIGDPVLIAELDPMDRARHRILYVNNAFERRTGYPHEEAIDASPEIVFGERTDLHALARIAIAVYGGRVASEEMEFYRKDRSSYWAAISVAKVFDREDGSFVYVAIHHDLDERKAQEIAAARREEFVRSVIESLPAEVVMIDSKSNIVAVNRSASRSGWHFDESIPRSYLEIATHILGAKGAERIASGIRDVLARKIDRFSVDVNAAREDRARWLHVDVVPNVLASEETGVVISHTDVTERVLGAQRLSWVADHDALTGLPNRHLLIRELRDAISNCGPENLLGLIFLDLDGFRRVNDTLGHEAGDELLTEVAMRLSFSSHRNELIARLGGDEFVILVPDASPNLINGIASNIIDAISEPYTSISSQISLSIAQGVAITSDKTFPAADLLRQADTAMYRAKEQGRNKVVFFDEEMATQLATRLELESALKVAITSDQLTQVYQPIVEIDSGKVVAFEALLRWNHITRGPIRPYEVIALAEDAGIMQSLGKWVLRRAARQVREWLNQGVRVPVSVNVSVNQLVGSFLEEVSSTVEEFAIEPALLHLEVTESAVMADPKLSISTLQELSDMGFSIMMDDFGTGQSTLAALKGLPVDAVKLDQSFVSGLDASEGPDAQIVDAVVRLTTALGLHAIAEGVETGFQASSLSASGCRYAQGYHFLYPSSAEQALAYMRQKGIGVWKPASK
ncbi:MAG: EAL domain-containing protein [Acidimicrobiaceae bacterium]|nr:EAL domain-containing protein [Acidimicrobiaceae bacterium]